MDNKDFDSIGIDDIDLTKHKIIIPAGTSMFRYAHKGADPLKPTGKAGRFSSEPIGYSIEKYSKAFDMGPTYAIHCGTGPICFSQLISTANLEVRKKIENKELYKMTLNKNIELISIDSICESLKMTKPFIIKERHHFFHKFYGKKEVLGLYIASAADYMNHNYVIFMDKFPNFKNIVNCEKING